MDKSMHSTPIAIAIQYFAYLMFRTWASPTKVTCCILHGQHPFYELYLHFLHAV